MTRALVTGVAGFIGSHLAEHCLSMGFDVVGIDDLSGGSRDNVPAGVEFHHASVTDPDQVARLWEGGRIDYVYHLAAYAAEGLSHFIRRYNYHTNLVGSINLINQSILHHIKCFVFTSSIAVYGENQTPMVETLTPRPADPYGISKYAVELDLAAASRQFGLPFVVFRPHNVYGERQNIADRYRNVIGIFMNQVMNGQPMTVFGDGLQTRAFSYVADVAPTIAQAPLVEGARNQVFNIGAEQPYTILELTQEVAAALGVSADVQHLPERNEVRHAFASHTKLYRIFGIPQATSLADGLARMASWATSRGPLLPVSYDNIEVPLGLPPSWQ